MPVSNYFRIFPYLFSVTLHGKTCSIYHPSFYWCKDIRCISCSKKINLRKAYGGTVPVSNYFWIFPDLFSVALHGKTCATYHPSFYWCKDIRCMSCSSDWEVRSSQNRVFPTRNIEKSANSERRRLVDLNCKMNTEISPVKTSRNWDKERDQIEGRETALFFSCVICMMHLIFGYTWQHFNQRIEDHKRNRRSQTIS